jgi:hypothetical protein
VEAKSSAVTAEPRCVNEEAREQVRLNAVKWKKCVHLRMLQSKMGLGLAAILCGRHML